MRKIDEILLYFWTTSISRPVFKVNISVKFLNRTARYTKNILSNLDYYNNEIDTDSKNFIALSFVLNNKSIKK